jgi:hypothetical protein
MADIVQPLAAPLDELRKILERREKASLDLAARSPTPRSGQASREEAAFFGGLRLLLDELQIARTRIHGDPSRPVSNSATGMARCPPGELSPRGVDQLLSEIDAHNDHLLRPMLGRS